jgi:hypothetical protein
MFRLMLVVSLALAAVATAGVAGPTGAGTASVPTRSAPAAQLSQLLAFVDGALVRIDPQSLQALPGDRIQLGSGGCASRGGGTACWSNPPWTVSPNGRQIAVARNDASSLRLVDVRRMRTTANMRVEGGAIGALAWLAPGRLLAVQEAPGERQRLLALDLSARRVVARTSLEGSVLQIARTGRQLAMLVAPARTIGPARIAIVDARGTVRFANVGRIAAGAKLLSTRQHRVEGRHPGLAVDPDTRRAYVVGDTLVADVDLRSRSVSYHSLERKPSLLARLWSWLEPTASAKLVNGYYRQASWLGGGLVAVSGTDTQQGRWQPTGLVAVDTSTWDVRTIDRGGTSFRVADDFLLAWGAASNGAAAPPVGIGLKAYDLEGRELFHLFDGQLVSAYPVYGGRAYVSTPDTKELRVVDLATGTVVATRQRLPWLLLGAGDSWWGT